MKSQPVRSIQAVRAGMLYVTAGALLWALVESIGTRLGSSHSPLQVVWMRYATHLALLVAIFAPRRRMALVRTARPRLQVFRGLLMLLMPLFFLAAIHKSGPANTLGVFWVTPLVTMALAAWLLRERVESWIWLVAFGGWVGALLIVQPGAFGVGMAPALGMALCFSLYLVLTRLLRDESTLTNLIFTAACVLAPLTLIMPRFWDTPTLRSLVMMASIGLLGLGLLYAFDRALELAPVATVAPALFVQPVWTVAIALLAGETQLGHRTLLGTVLIVILFAVLFVGAGWRQPQHVLAGARQLWTRS